MRGIVVLALAIGACILSGCTSVAPTKAQAGGAGAPVARLAILNQSGCAWRIAVTPAAGGGSRAWRVAAAASLEVDVPAGDYLVEQTMLGEATAAEDTRRFPMRVEAGQSYRWRLVTLLSP